MHKKQSVNNFLAKVRESEIKYHEELYTSRSLGEKGSWLFRPPQFILDSFSEIFPNSTNNLEILDLGAGIGRVSIPIAERIGENSRVECIDILEIADAKLNENAQKYGVSEKIISTVTDIENFDFSKKQYDCIIAVSSIEHVSSFGSFQKVIKQIKQATKKGGINIFMITSDISWKEKETGKNIPPLVEINLNSRETILTLKEIYFNWKVHKVETKNWKTNMSYKGKEIDFTNTCISFFCQNII